VQLVAVHGGGSVGGGVGSGMVLVVGPKHGRKGLESWAKHAQDRGEKLGVLLERGGLGVVLRAFLAGFN